MIAVGTAVVVAVVAGHSYPDYDAMFALVWGDGLAHGHGPDYTLGFRPGGHPLTTAVAAVLSPLGAAGAAEVFRWLVLLGTGALVAGVFRLGQALAGTAVGVVAAVIVFTRTPTWGFTALGYMDFIAVAFVVWALVLELRSPRRGAPVLALLAVAGLVRPEPWLLAGAYWIWLAWGGRLGTALRLLPLALAGPVMWLAWDMATTQTFFGSVRTEPGSPVGPSSGGTGLGEAPEAIARYIGGYLRPPEAVAAALGIVVLALRRDRRLLMPLAVITGNLIAFLLVARSGGALEQRYLLPAAVVLAALGAYGVLAWRRPGAGDDPRSRAVAPARPVRVAAAACALALIAYAPIDLDRLHDLRARVRVADRAYGDLRELTESRAVRCALAGQVHVPDVRLRPFIAYWGEVPLERIGTDPAETGDVAALDTIAQQVSSRSLPESTARSALPPPQLHPGFRPLAGNGSWRVAGRC